MRIGRYLFDFKTCTATTSNNINSWTDLTVDRDSTGRLRAYIEADEDVRVATKRNRFTSFDSSVLGARVRFRYRDNTGTRSSYAQNACCYFKELGDVRVAASYFTRYFSKVGISATSRVAPFVSKRRSRNKDK